jgi:hypothetical protein
VGLKRRGEWADTQVCGPVPKPAEPMTLLLRRSSMRSRSRRTAALVLLGCCLWAGRADGVAGGGGPPANTGLPQISGPAQAGQTLSCSPGSWTGAPTSYSYAWSRGGTPVAGATSQAYGLTAADVGSAITCTVTASNPDGATAATSAPTGTVVAAPSGSSPATPPAAPAPSPLPKAAEVILLPGKRSCASRRKFRIRVKAVAGVTYSSVAVWVNGKRVKVLKGERTTAQVNLRGLPRGTFAARIAVTTKDGRKLKHTRRYRTCEPGRRGKRKHRL